MFNNPKHEVIFKNDWVQLIKSQDGFFYLQRCGKNSIAVLLYNHKGEVLVRYQPMCAVEKLGPSTERLAPCPITGSLDDNEVPIKAAIREAKEEAGYGIEDMIEEVGSYIVSTQCNEICYCYIADVEGITPDEPKGDGGYHESISYNKWVNIKDIPNLENIYGGLLILVNKIPKTNNIKEQNSTVNKLIEAVEKLEKECEELGFIQGPLPIEIAGSKKLELKDKLEKQETDKEKELK
jgi:hypothetical protein